MSNNAVLDNILTRRSCRAYTDRPVSKEDLDTILKAAIYAPSGMSRQSWQFTVIRKKENIQELAKVVRETLNRPESYNFYDPDVIILASNEKDNTNGLADCACAMENMFLMAQELGIGSCWINQLKEICDEPQVRAELKKFGVPDNHIVWGIVDLGYAAQEPVCKEKNVFNIIMFSKHINNADTDSCFSRTCSLYYQHFSMSFFNSITNSQNCFFLIWSVSNLIIDFHINQRCS